MSKSELFLSAWSIAKKAAAKFGGSSKSYFPESLRIANAAAAIDFGMSDEDYRARRGVGFISRDEAIALCNYLIAKAQYSFIRTGKELYAERIRENVQLRENLFNANSSAMFRTSHISGIKILNR